MLRELRIRDYAVIEELRLELGDGLNVLTGETGAGKSILVGALALLLGDRAQSDIVRSGAQRAVVEGVFEVASGDPACERCRDIGIDPDHGSLILRREVQRAGRSRGWVNGSPATAGFLRELGSELVELHGQHEHQRLLHTDAQRELLDVFGTCQDVSASVEAEHRTLCGVRVEIEQLTLRAAEARERADYLRFKAEEIEAAGLEPGEDERLAAEARRLEHSEDLLRLSGSLVATIQGDEGSLAEGLGNLQGRLTELLRIDAGATEFTEFFETARAAIEELGGRLSSYSRQVEHDPARLLELRSRLDELYRLKRKYGNTLDSVLEAGGAARAELDELSNSSELLNRLAAEAAASEQRLDEMAGRLTKAREKAARSLEVAVSSLLPSLGMPGAVFQIGLERQAAVGKYGAERVEFRASLNPGFAAGPLGRIASGGELSRLMLGIRTLTALDDVPSIVFDEIDAGVGGRVAHQVGARLAEVARGRQVFAVTHLAQIASRADHHLRVEKASRDGMAVTRVTRLGKQDRIDEVARMLGGDSGSGTSRQHASEMLEAGRSKA